MPLLLARRPGVRFRIVGRDPSAAVHGPGRGPRSRSSGFVDDVRPWLAGSAVVVVPMVSGSGVKNKLLEAMSIGRPIVTTSLGVESLDIEPGRDLLVADDPAAYAEALDRLLGDPGLQARLGAAARERVVATVLLGRLRRALRRAVRGPGRDHRASTDRLNGDRSPARAAGIPFASRT